MQGSVYTAYFNKPIILFYAGFSLYSLFQQTYNPVLCRVVYTAYFNKHIILFYAGFSLYSLFQQTSPTLGLYLKLGLNTGYCFIQSSV